MHKAKVLSIEKIAENIYKLLIEKPKGYTFIPGQYAEISIIEDVKSKYNRNRHFSFTGLADAKNLEFIFKLCDNNDAITKRIIGLKPKDELLIGKAKGSLRYKGMGAFIAGGIGITPFISIFRDLKRKKDLAGNMLIYSNKTISDTILDKELSEMPALDVVKLLTGEKRPGLYFGRIDHNFLRMSIVDFVRYFYISGSNEFVANIISILKDFGVDASSMIYELK